LAQEAAFDYEVIVVDSSPNSVKDWIRTTYPSVRVISSPDRLNPGTARNLGAQNAQGKRLAFLDADAYPSPGWLQGLSSRLDSDPRIHVIGGFVSNANPETLPSRVLHWAEFSEFLPGLPSGFRTMLSSSNLMLERQGFLDSGGFDENFAMAEDLIFSQSFREKLYFEGSVGVRHHHRTRWSDIRRHLHGLGYWSGRFRASHETSGSWIARLPLLSFLLPPFRLAKIMARVFRAGKRRAVSAMACSPLLLWALFSWAIGFYAGLRTTPHSPSPGRDS
jgi:glycosyltransferase involved in cell wall biosynthesis